MRVPQKTNGDSHNIFLEYLFAISSGIFLVSALAVDISVQAFVHASL